MWLWNDINIFRSANEIRETGQNRSRFSCNRQPNTIPNKDNYLPGTFTCKESETSQQHEVLIYHASLSEVVYYFFILEQDLQGLLERLSSLPDLSGVCDSRIVHLWFSVQCYVDHCLSVFCVVLCRSLSVRFLFWLLVSLNFSYLQTSRGIHNVTFLRNQFVLLIIRRKFKQ